MRVIQNGPAAWNTRKLAPGLSWRMGWRLVIGLCCATVLVSCGQGNGERPAANGQVVARLGDQVVTTLELDSEFRAANIPPAKQKDPDLVRKALGDLIARKYLVGRALNSKLDREPGVLLDLLRAREQVLATAYLNRAAAARPPGRADVDSYIADHPEKFEKREIFGVEQIAFPLSNTSQSVVDVSSEARSLDEVEQRLKEAGIPHARQAGSFSSGDLSAELVRLVHSDQPDHVFFVRAGANGVYFKVLRAETRPLAGEAAAEAARQALRTDALKAEAGLAAFSANAEAQYEGEYAQIMGHGKAAATKN